MGKASKAANKSNSEENPEGEEKQRLRKLAFAKRILSQSKANPAKDLDAAKIIKNSDGKDIVKKGHRKSKYLFSFPCLVAPVSGGKMGDLLHLDTQNPVLYVDFPQGRMKFFGTIVYPKNKYLILYFLRGSGNIICEDSFDSLVVFSDVRWIGTKEENPDELPLDFPTALKQEKHADIDFKGGAGRVSDAKSIVGESVMSKKCNDLLEDSDTKENIQKPSEISSNPVNLNIEQDEKSTPARAVMAPPKSTPTPVRASARTAGKTFKFVESPSDDDDVDSIEGNSSSSGSIKESSEVKMKVNRSLGVALEGTLGNITPTELETLHDESKMETDSGRNLPSKGALVQSNLSRYMNKTKEKKSEEHLKSLDIKANKNRQKGTSSSKTKNMKANLEEADETADIQMPTKRKRKESGKGKSKGRKKSKSSKTFASDDDQSSSLPEVSDDSDEDWTV